MSFGYGAEKKTMSWVSFTDPLKKKNPVSQRAWLYSPGSWHKLWWSERVRSTRVWFSAKGRMASCVKFGIWSALSFHRITFWLISTAVWFQMKWFILDIWLDVPCCQVKPFSSWQYFQFFKTLKTKGTGLTESICHGIWCTSSGYNCTHHKKGYQDLCILPNPIKVILNYFSPHT